MAVARLNAISVKAASDDQVRGCLFSSFRLRLPRVTRPLRFVVTLAGDWDAYDLKWAFENDFSLPRDCCRPLSPRGTLLLCLQVVE